MTVSEMTAEQQAADHIKTADRMEMLYGLSMARARCEKSIAKSADMAALFRPVLAILDARGRE